MLVMTEAQITNGLVYVEDIYRYLESFGNFDHNTCDAMRKAVCKRLPERRFYRNHFIDNFGQGIITAQNTNPEKMYDMLEKAMETAIHKHQCVSNFVALCSRKFDSL